MMKSFLITHRSFAVLLVLSLLLPAISYAQSNGYVADWLESYRLSGDFSTTSLFEMAPDPTDLHQVVDRTTQLNLNQPALHQLLASAPLTLTFLIPNAYGETFALELVKTDILAPGFSVGTLGTQAADKVAVDPGIHYRGVLKGNHHSVATLSIFSTGIVAMVSDERGTWQLAQMEDGTGHYVLYRTADLNIPSPMQCFTDESGGSASSVDDRGVGCRTVQIYFECDYKLYQDKGSNTSTVTTYVTSLFNQVAALYANENIGVAISQIYVWTSPDPYANITNIGTVLDNFRSTRGTGFTGNLAHFLTTRSLGGGIGYVDVICLKQYAFGVSMITTSFLNVPTYSWTVEVVTHELGHNLGSWHTHSCNWPNGALDNCYTPEGNCSPGPAPVNGGTIMSYCHLTGYGINFANGFGTIPGNLVRSKVTAATCAAQSGTAPNGLAANNLTASSASLSWGAVSGATVYTVQYKLTGASTYSDAGTTTATTFTLNGLSASSGYNWQVKTDCSGYSSPGSFTTTAGGGSGGGGNTTCSAPLSLSTTGISTAAAVLSWAAVSGATSYTVQYKTSTATVWSTAGNSLTSSYNLNGLTASTIYNWKVKANCSDYGNVASFTTASSGGGATGCAAPTNLLNNTVTANAAVISWSPVSGASNYTLQIKLTNYPNYFTLGTVSGTKVMLSGLQPSTTYYWRVKANCSDYSYPLQINTPASITPQPTGLMPVLSVHALQLSVYPNPTADRLTVNYTGEITPGTRFMVTDVTGKIVSEQQLASEEQSLDVSQFPAGMYILVLMEGDARVGTERFVRAGGR
jgi:hypothetical protein